jgi:hypothetical protein
VRKHFYRKIANNNIRISGREREKERVGKEDVNG